MTLGGLAAAIGLVIDDAIVVVENIVVHRDRGQARTEAVRSALREITTPLIGSTVTPVVVFLPLIAVTGVTGSFFRALAVTMTAALLTSLFLALTFTPALSLSLLRQSDGEAATKPISNSSAVTHDENGPFMRRVLELHRRALDWTIRRNWALAAIAVVLITSGYSAYSALGSNLLPEMDEGSFILDTTFPAGSSLAASQKMIGKVEEILRDTPEVLITSRRTGLQLGLAAVTESNYGDLTVRLKQKRSRSVQEVMNEVRRRVKEAVPQLDAEYTQILQDNINDLSNSPEPIQIKLFSTDINLLNELGPKVQAAISAIPGIVDTQNGVDNTLSGPATTFQVDPAVASRLGFTVQEVAEDATSLMDGLPTTDPVIVAGRPYTVRVRMSEEHRASLSAIENTVFNSATGHTATLGALAEIKELPPQNEIRRENLEQVVLVSGRLEGSNLGGAMVKVKGAVAKLNLPASVRVEYGGTYEEQQKSFRELVQVLILALALAC
jgi:multidrug efflux pump subunit AcrB